jgi:Domain of Unknown Function (DUF1080)
MTISKTRSTLVFAMIALSLTAANAEMLSFEGQPVGSVPAGFTVALTGNGKPPVWVLQQSPDGKGGVVVAQTSAEATDYRFPLLVYDTISAADVDLSVTFQAVSGSEDQAAGLVWRYRDANNYYVVRANALEDNVVLYKVQNGRRIDLPLKGKGKTYGATAPVPRKVWNTLAVQVRGSTFAVSLNGKALYEVDDTTFPAAGKIGLWTKADSVTLFKDFNISPAK